MTMFSGSGPLHPAGPFGFFDKKKKKNHYDPTPAAHQVQFDPETGMPQGLSQPPSAQHAPAYQFKSEQVVARRNAQLRREARGYLDGAGGLMESYRPGGSASMAAGVRQGQASAAFSSQIQAPDLMFGYREDARKKAEKKAKKAARMQAIGGAIQGIGSIASMIPGAGTAVGAGLGAIGGAVSGAGAAMGREGEAGGSAQQEGLSQGGGGGGTPNFAPGGGGGGSAPSGGGGGGGSSGGGGGGWGQAGGAGHGLGSQSPANWAQPPGSAGPAGGTPQTSGVAGASIPAPPGGRQLGGSRGGVGPTGGPTASGNAVIPTIGGGVLQPAPHSVEGQAAAQAALNLQQQESVDRGARVAGVAGNVDDFDDGFWDGAETSLRDLLSDTLAAGRSMLLDMRPASDAPYGPEEMRWETGGGFGDPEPFYGPEPFVGPPDHPVGSHSRWEAHRVERTDPKGQQAKRELEAADALEWGWDMWPTTGRMTNRALQHRNENYASDVLRGGKK